MVIVDKGTAMIRGDVIDVSLDIIGFLDAINKLKQENYEKYILLETTLKVTLKEEPEFINVIKEFSINMTEMFN